mgnify:CR=1 FL=1
MTIDNPSFAQQIKPFRDEIDDIDARIISLLSRRREQVEKIVEVKKAHKVPIYHPAREEDVISRLRHRQNHFKVALGLEHNPTQKAILRTRGRKDKKTRSLGDIHGSNHAERYGMNSRQRSQSGFLTSNQSPRDDDRARGGNRRCKRIGGHEAGHFLSRRRQGQPRKGQASGGKKR